MTAKLLRDDGSLPDLVDLLAQRAIARYNHRINQQLHRYYHSDRFHVPPDARSADPQPPYNPKQTWR